MNEEYIKRINEIEQITKVINSKGLVFKKREYKTGISVIVPTYKGEAYIGNCLRSLYSQTLPQVFYEVIIIINGEKDSTEAFIDQFINNNDINNISVNYISEANVSKARNLGIELAHREYITFIDDDDFISSNYLEKMYQYTSCDTVAISQIVDVDNNDVYIADNLINQQVLQTTESDQINISSVSYVLSMNACKALPTHIVKKYRYNPALRSGEDVIFFTELFTKNNLKISVIPKNDQAIYFRCLKEASISRQKLNFDFHVSQRLDVIKNLDSLLKKTKREDYKAYIRQKIKSQFSFVRKYLLENLNEKNEIYNEIYKHQISYFPKETISIQIEDAK